MTMVDALLVVEALGNRQGVDPGKPGHGAFAKPIYEAAGLRRLSTKLVAPVRHKLSAHRISDRQETPPTDVIESYVSVLEALRGAEFDALVMDYDGTIVTTDERLSPPAPAIINELSRLIGGGVMIGIATGRGGSAGEMLRDVLPPDQHRAVIMGYYNGGVVRTLDVNISEEPPPVSPIMQAVYEWLDRHPGILHSDGRRSSVQVSIDTDRVADLANFLTELKKSPLMESGEIRFAMSMHSIDIVLAGSTKLNVLGYMSSKLSRSVTALRIGDSGHHMGNDFELLGHEFGISVDRVCHRPNGCWSLFGSNLRGPEALLAILRASNVVRNGVFQLDIDRLISAGATSEG